MKAKSLTYCKLTNTGNFEHSKIEITIEIEEGETARDVLEAAKKFVNTASKMEGAKDRQITEAEKVLSDPDSYTGWQVKQANKTIKESSWPTDGSDLPF